MWLDYFHRENKSLESYQAKQDVKSTLSTWKRKAEKEKGNTKPKRNLTPNEKFLVAMETYGDQAEMNSTGQM